MNEFQGPPKMTWHGHTSDSDPSGEVTFSLWEPDSDKYLELKMKMSSHYQANDVYRALRAAYETGFEDAKVRLESRLVRGIRDLNTRYSP